MKAHPTRAQTPPSKCTTPDPAKSKMFKVLVRRNGLGQSGILGDKTMVDKLEYNLNDKQFTHSVDWNYWLEGLDTASLT